MASCSITGCRYDIFLAEDTLYGDLDSCKDFSPIWYCICVSDYHPLWLIGIHEEGPPTISRPVSQLSHCGLGPPPTRNSVLLTQIVPRMLHGKLPSPPNSVFLWLGENQPISLLGPTWSPYSFVYSFRPHKDHPIAVLLIHFLNESWFTPLVYSKMDRKLASRSIYLES